MSESEEGVNPPVCKFGDGIPLHIYRQVLQSADIGQGVQLLKATYVGRTEHKGLQKT